MCRCHDWLDVSDWIRFRLCIQVYKCRHSMAHGYLIDFCQPVASIDGQTSAICKPWSAAGSTDQVATYGSRAFGLVGPFTRNALPNTLKCSSHCLPTFSTHLKHFYAQQQIMFRASLSYRLGVRLSVCHFVTLCVRLEFYEKRNQITG